MNLCPCVLPAVQCSEYTKNFLKNFNVCLSQSFMLLFGFLPQFLHHRDINRIFSVSLSSTFNIQDNDKFSAAVNYFIITSIFSNNMVVKIEELEKSRSVLIQSWSVMMVIDSKKAIKSQFNFHWNFEATILIACYINKSWQVWLCR